MSVPTVLWSKQGYIVQRFSSGTGVFLKALLVSQCKTCDIPIGEGRGYLGNVMELGEDGTIVLRMKCFCSSGELHANASDHG